MDYDLEKFAFPLESRMDLPIILTIMLLRNIKKKAHK